MITAVVTCMGRRQHLEATLSFTREAFNRVIVVDWNCPEHSGDYAMANGAKAVYKSNEQFFNGSKAKNFGARFVESEYVAFVDADTVCLPTLKDELASLVRPGRMILSARTAEGKEVNDTVGFLVCETASFWSVGGFDESWIGWGHEDIHLRGKLFLDAKLEVARLSPMVLGAIAHSNQLRSEHREAPIEVTAVAGFKVLADWFASKGIENFNQNPKVQDIVFAGTPENFGA